MHLPVCFLPTVLALMSFCVINPQSISKKKRREAGRAVRLRANPNLRMPQLIDERHIATGEVMSKDAALRKIEQLTDQLLADDDENELSNADAKLLATSQFEPVYDSVELSEAVRIAELTEARKTISRRKAKFDEDKPRFLGYILSRLSENAKYKLKSQPNYSKARDEEDLVAIWKMIEEMHGSRGQYSDVLISQKLFAARQGSKSFEAYVVYFQDLLDMLAVHGAAPSNRDQTIMFLQSIN